MRRSHARLAAAAALVAIAAPAAADESRQVLPSGESTHHSGLGIVLSATYPANTLHVGMAGGQESSRAYLGFDLPDAEEGTFVDRIVLTVPVADDAGTSAPEAARLQVCSVPDGVTDGAAVAPETDCNASLPAQFRSGSAPAVVADVTDLVRDDRVDVALVPSGGDGWHIGFDSRAREGGSPSSLTVTLETGGSVAPVAGIDDVAPTPAAPSAPALGGGPVAIPDLSPPPVAAGQSIAEGADATDAAQSRSLPVPATGDAGFQYPIVFALPLVLLIAIAVAGDGLTRPVVLHEERA